MRLCTLLASTAFLPPLCLHAAAYTASITTESVSVLSHQHSSDVTLHVQSLYDLMNGTFALPAYFGSEARVSGLYLTNSTEDIPYADYRKSGHFQTDVGSLDKRYTETVTKHSCTSPPQFQNRLVTYEQQKFIAGKFCTWVSNVSPYAYGVMAIKISNIMCGAGGRFRCNAFFSIVHTKVGGTIGSGIQAMCTPSYKALVEACDEKGGMVDVTIDQTGASFQVEGYANSAEDEPCTSTSTSLCKSYTCHGNCNPGGGVP